MVRVRDSGYYMAMMQVGLWLGKLLGKTMVMV